MSGIGGEILVVLSGGLDTSGRVETDPRVVVAERIARAWLTVKGSMPWARDRGLGLRQLVNADLSFSKLRMIEGDAAREARRVDGVTQAAVTSRYSGGALTLTGKFTIDSSQTFTLTVDSAGAAEVLF